MQNPIYEEKAFTWAYAPIGTVGRLERFFKYAGESYALLHNGQQELAVPAPYPNGVDIQEVCSEYMGTLFAVTLEKGYIQLNRVHTKI